MILDTLNVGDNIKNEELKTIDDWFHKTTGKTENDNQTDRKQNSSGSTYIPSRIRKRAFTEFLDKVYGTNSNKIHKTNDDNVQQSLPVSHIQTAKKSKNNTQNKLNLDDIDIADLETDES